MRAPMAARKFQPGQFYRLQNFETFAPVVASTTGTPALAMEGLALTGAWVDTEKGLLGTIVLEMGGSSRLCAALAAGRADRPHGPDRHADRDRQQGDGAALRRRPRQRGALLDRARLQGARRARCSTSPATSSGEDLFKRDDIERYTDQVIWCTDMRRRRSRRAARRTGTSAATSCRRWWRTPPAQLGGPPAIPLTRGGPHHRHRLRPHDERRPRGAPRRARAAPRSAAPRHRQHQLADAVHDEGGLRAVPAEADGPADRQGARRLHLLQPGPGARRGRLPQPPRAPAGQLDAGEAERTRGSTRLLKAAPDVIRV